MSWAGGFVGPATWCVLAPNPGPMTLDGTNTWLVHSAGRAVVVDPGPLDAHHLSAVTAAARDRGVRVTGVLLTHGHLDHSEGAADLAARLSSAGHRVGVRALDPRWRLGDEGLVGGDVVRVGDVELRVVATPGHSSDSLSFVLHGEPGAGPSLLTGDTVLGRGTTVVAHPDGRLDAYLGSLHRLRDWVADQAGGVRVLPGHGPVLADAGDVLDGYLAHRRERLEQVRDAVAAGDRDPASVVRRVYADVDRSVWPAAERSVRAQLDYLAENP